MIERLDVALDFGADRPPRKLGRLGRDPASRATAFEWDAAFATSPLPVSPVVITSYAGLLRPNAERRATLPGLFEDSLPDGWGRLLLDRELARRGVDRSAIGDLDRLAHVGRYGMGALVYRPEAAAVDREPIDLAWFEGAIGRIEGETALEEIARLRAISGGSQGARPKLVALLDASNERLRDHRSACPSGWRHVIVKGRASSDPRGAVEAELAYAAAMRLAGIETSPVAGLRGGRELFLAADRFDRPDGGRLHMASVAGLLDCGMAIGAVDYVDLVKLARRVCRSATVVEDVFRRMVFNVRAGNRDDHVRNHAFLMDESGTWRLAPAYDVSFSEGPGGEHAMAVAGEGRRPGRGAIERVAALAGIGPRRRDTILEEVDAALAAWPRLAGEHAVPRTLADPIAAHVAAARLWP